MDQIPNGDISNGILNGNSNGNGNLVTHPAAHAEQSTYTNGMHEPSLGDLERELPLVHDGQIPLGELVSRMAQSIYAELTELAETMPNMSDIQRKRTLAEWVVKTKKQVVKLYAVVRWSRDADIVQKAMNVTAFLMDQNQQFVDAINGLIYAKESLDPARLRNHDLLTSLDVLTSGSYLRLPTAIRKLVIPPPQLSDEDVAKTLSDMEGAIRYRLRMSEFIPLEMSEYRIADGRAFFTAPELFTTSLCLRGAQRDDGWFFVDVEFLFNVGGDPTGMQEFPRKPSGIPKRHVADEADARLAFYLPLAAEQNPPPAVEVPPRPQLPDGMIDTPLVRLFNFLQMMSLSYQLEILWYQAERMRSLGWADYLTAEMSNHRQMLTISYWIRKPPPKIPGKPPPPPNRQKLPSLGGTLIISIVPTQSPVSIHPTRSTAHPPIRDARNRVLAELQQRAKLGENNRPSDVVERMRLEVRWEPQRGALGVVIPQEATVVAAGELEVNPQDLDIEALLLTVIRRHTQAILIMFQLQLQQGPYQNIFSLPGTVTLLSDAGSLALRTHLCADEVVVITIDPRTGRLSLRDTGDLAAAGRGPRFAVFSERLNESPSALAEALVRLRLNAITDLAEQKANYLGLQSHRFRNFSREELQKLGPAARGMLYIQLATSPKHYLVVVITDEQFRFALISTKTLGDTMYTNLIMEDIAWLDVQRIHGENLVFGPQPANSLEAVMGHAQAVGSGTPAESPSSFRLESQVLRKLYAYCCARVAYTSVERQLKNHGIPFTRVDPSAGAILPAGMDHLQSPLMRSIPALCVQSSDILSGAPAAEAAMPNIRVIPLNWWSESQPQVVTCVKLKYVQQPIGKRAGTSAIIRPSKRIIYDTTEAVVSFLSEDIDKCVDEFLEEWARVSKMVVIAREVGQMATDKHWADVRLLSFDLQTVEFAYASDYSVSITCTDQLSPTGGSYELRFSRPRNDLVRIADEDHSRYNPHTEVEPFLRNVLRHGRLAPSLRRLVALLRDTLPIALELQSIQKSASEAGNAVDTFAKAAGWFRVLHGDLRHALDFRLLTGARVVVLDASHSLFQDDDEPPRGSAHYRDARFSTIIRESMAVLQPIPGFRTIVQEIAKEVGSQSQGKVFTVDIGIICDTSAVQAVGEALYNRVVKSLKESSGASG